MRRRTLAAAAIAGVLTVAWNLPLAASPPENASLYDALDRLKTLGVMPLWAAAARPIAPAELQAALVLAARRAETMTLSAADQALLAQLIREFGPERPSDPRRQIDVTTRAVDFGLMRVEGSLLSVAGGTAWTAGWAHDSYRAAIFSSTPDLTVVAGREPLGWGPGGDGGLLFTQAAGGFDLVQLSYLWGRIRFTKVIGWLDGDRSLVATRMDVPYRPNLRLGFGEAVLMQGAPYLVYTLVPAPMILSPYLQQQVRAPLGFNDNYFLTLDAEWVPRPGLRIYGELLVDDYTVPTPTANYPSRWGLTLGLHRVPESGPEFRGHYTIVANWTYSATDPALHYLLRGLPLGHPLGADFDLLHLRWMHAGRASHWITYVRKGEGEVGRIWVDEAEARQFPFLRGVVEYSVIAGVEIPVTTAGGWTGTIGPWLAFRTNANHVQDATRLDAGLSISVSQTY